MILIMKICCK